MRTVSRVVPGGMPTALGAVAYLVGYAAAFALLGADVVETAASVVVRVRAGAAGSVVSDPSLASLVGSAVPATTWAGWLHYNAHFVPVVEWAYPTSTVTVPNLLRAGPASWLALFAVPPVLLLAAGAIAARDVPPSTVDELPVIRLKLPAGTVKGLAIWTGYLPLAVLGAFLFSAPTGHAALAPFAPSLVGAVLVAGLFYPIVFGGIGGWLGSRTGTTNEAADQRGRSAGR